MKESQYGGGGSSIGRTASRMRASTSAVRRTRWCRHTCASPLPIARSPAPDSTRPVPDATGLGGSSFWVGIRELCTWNASENGAIWEVNRRLGFVRRPAQ